MDDSNVVRVAQQLCNAGANAIRHYVEVSGEAASTMPEYFLTCSLFNALAGERAITLEAPFWQIHQWMREGSRTPPLDNDSERWKLDMVIYDGGAVSPHEQKIWGFVEVKNGFIDADPIPGRRSDRDKLKTLAKLFPNLEPKLICCGALNAERRGYHIEKAAKMRNRWFEAATGGLPYENEKHFSVLAC